MTPLLKLVGSALVTLAAAGSNPAGGSNPTSPTASFEAHRAFIDKCDTQHEGVVMATVGKDNARLRLRCVKIKLVILEEAE